MSLDPLYPEVQITIQLPLMENTGTKPHILEIYWSHHCSSSSYCFQAMKDLVQCTEFFPLTHEELIQQVRTQGRPHLCHALS